MESPSLAAKFPIVEGSPETLCMEECVYVLMLKEAEYSEGGQ